MLPRTDTVVTDSDRVVVKGSPLNAEAAPRALGETLTPGGSHYLRAHFAPPDVDWSTHAIAVEGALANAFSLSLSELLTLPRRHVTMTMECAGNRRLGMMPLPPGEPWDRGAVSTASWSGVPLALILERAGVRDDVVEIVAGGADSGTPDGATSAMRYARGLPLDKARDPDTLIALEMNGRPLPFQHGGPARLIVPGWYGMASVKWLARLQAVTTPFDGWFQRDRYVYDDGSGHVEPVAQMRVASHLVSPARQGTHLRGKILAWGWAWSGAAPLASVELALDGGEYRAAQLAEPLAPHAWRRFELTLDVPTLGRHTLRARARDEAGNVQPERPVWNRLGYGNNAVTPLPFYIV